MVEVGLPARCAWSSDRSLLARHGLEASVHPLVPLRNSDTESPDKPAMYRWAIVNGPWAIVERCSSKLKLVLAGGASSRRAIMTVRRRESCLARWSD